MFDNENSTFTIADLVEGVAEGSQNTEITTSIKEEASEQSILDFIVPSAETVKEEKSETKKVDYRALYNMRVEAGEFLEVEDADKLDWTKKETYDAIVKFHEKPEQPKSQKNDDIVSQNAERVKIIGEQKKFIEDLKDDKFSTKEGYSQLIKYDYVQVKGLTEDEFKSLFDGLTEDQITEKGEALKNSFIGNAESIIKTQEKAEREEGKAKKEADEKAKKEQEESIATYRAEAKKSAKELDVTEEYIDKCIDMYQNGDIHKLIEKFVTSNVSNPIELVKFIEEKMGTNKTSKKTIKLEELQLNK